MALQLHVRAGKYCFQEALPLFVSEAPPSHAELPLSGMLLACVALSGLPRVEVVAADAIAKPCYLGISVTTREMLPSRACSEHLSIRAHADRGWARVDQLQMTSSRAQR